MCVCFFLFGARGGQTSVFCVGLLRISAVLHTRVNVVYQVYIGHAVLLSGLYIFFCFVIVTKKTRYRSITWRVAGREGKRGREGNDKLASSVWLIATSSWIVNVDLASYYVCLWRAVSTAGRYIYIARDQRD